MTLLSEVQIKVEKQEEQMDGEQTEKEKMDTIEELPEEYCPEIVLCQENEEGIRKECLDWAKINQVYENIDTTFLSACFICKF